MNDVSRARILVVGASRGLGRGIATAFAEAGGDVVAVARTDPALAGVRAEIADAADESTASRLIDQYEPTVLVLVAGAVPVMGDLRAHTWATFSANWDADVKIAFTWLRAALDKPLPPGSRVVVMSSGAALNGSPLSGGYAGAKAAQRFIAQYAQSDSARAGLGITITTIMPRITPFGEVGRQGVRAYAELSGQSEEDFVAQLGTLTTPSIAGSAVLEVVRADPSSIAPAYVLTGDGLQPVG